ncbi:MAG: hypothetical protein JRI23_08335 [Deltaproteobacteria bacterium]|jgi:hypothetical protein|nr:hypothetical protein [Deltaproteobacteria bacterium]MBW2531621.1 hypothetical protein [Deltaproteobacteria bacterium]
MMSSSGKRAAAAMLVAAAALVGACSDEDAAPHQPGTTATGGVAGAGGTSSGSAGAGQGGSAAGSAGGHGGSANTRIAIPTVAEWTDQGTIFQAGTAGQWDLYLWGGFGGSAVLLAGEILLYYQGSDGYDVTEDTVTHRAIGVATSSDGLTFTKHGQNPVLTWLPNAHIEEGAASFGAVAATAGDVVAYYGANTAISASQVNADGRLAVSSDGLSFADSGVVLDHADDAVWGSGDELFPVAAVEHEGRWLAFYIPNGSPERGQLGVAWGTARDGLTDSGPVEVGGEPIAAWGMAGWAWLAADELALFVSDVQQDTIAAYRIDPTAPTSATGPEATFQFANMSQGTVLLDESEGRWLLYYRNADASAYGVRVAPVTRY